MKVALSEVASNYIVRTQYSVTCLSCHVTFCRFLPAEQCPGSWGLWTSHPLRNHWKKYTLYPRYYSKTQPKYHLLLLTNDRVCSYLNAKVKCILSRKRCFESNFQKCVYSMTKFGDDMVKLIDQGLRRLDKSDSWLIVRYSIWIAPYYEFLENINTYNSCKDPLRDCSEGCGLCSAEEHLHTWNLGITQN